MIVGQEAEIWNRCLDNVARELLAQANIGQPAVDALELAGQMQIVIAFDANQRARARQKRLAGRSTIFLKPEPRPERLQWAIAHELGEIFAHRVLDQIGISAADLPKGGREMVANLLATRLLLPVDWFVADERELRGNLLDLKLIYQTASHELIAWRFLDLSEQSIVTLFDQGRLTRRRSNIGPKPPPIHKTEQLCWKKVHEENRPVEIEDDGLTVRGWPVHEPGWKREILRTTTGNEPDVYF